MATASSGSARARAPRAFAGRLDRPSMPLSTIAEAIADLRARKFVIIVDDESRENEGDLAIAAERVTPEAINFMATHARGLICVALPGHRLDALQIPLLVSENTAPYGTP